MKPLGPSAVAVLAGAAAGVLYYLQNAGRTLTTLMADLGGYLGGTIQMTESQQQMVRTIERVFESKGLGFLVRAAVVNAYAESRLDPAAAGDGGASIGLFQLNRTAGVGKGWTVQQLEDPETNARLIADEAISRGALLQNGRGGVYLTRWFAEHVERCWACGHGGGDSDLDVREALYGRLYG